MIPVAFECPKSLLHENHDVQDYSFALAQYVLNDADYTKFQLGRCHTLDNGFHEMGKPLSIPELVEATKRAKPKVVVAPDWLDDARATLDATHEMRAALKAARLDHVAIMGVVQGTSLDEVRHCWDAMRHRVEVIGLPFKRRRVDWWYYCESIIQASNNDVHLLGVNELDELRQLRQFSSFKKLELAGRVRIDTGKPYKWALRGSSIFEVPSLRGSKVDADELYEARMNEFQKRLAFYNVAAIRKVLA